MATAASVEMCKEEIIGAIFEFHLFYERLASRTALTV